jgi:hypothetical protein
MSPSDYVLWATSWVGLLELHGIQVVGSVADPGCLYRIPDPDF